jgi:hypothetical protein
MVRAVDTGIINASALPRSLQPYLTWACPEALHGCPGICRKARKAEDSRRKRETNRGDISISVNVALGLILRGLMKTHKICLDGILYILHE